MTRLRIFLFRLRALTRTRRMAREIDEEIATHLAEATDEYVRQGLSEAQARLTAQRQFGGVLRTRDEYRQIGSFIWMEDGVRDVRLALRTLRRTPAFTVAAAITLALAIGVNTAMFSVLNAVLLRPLPYHAPDQLAMLWTEDPTQNLREGRSALWDVEQWRARTRTFAELATFDAQSATLTGVDGAEQIVAGSISSNLLPLIGVQPAQGRLFTSEEAEAREPLVLIGHRFWQTRFGGVRDAIGSAIVLNGQSSRIIGILPADFQIARLDADVWTPHPRVGRQARGSDTWFVIGRLRPGVPAERAQAEMTAIARELNAQLPAAERNRGVSVVPLALDMVGRQARLALWMLGGAVFCVFLIAAANVTSLSLARGAARAREMTVRAALGASAGRLVRQLLTESLLLATIAGAIGLLLAFAGICLIRAVGPATLPRLDEVSLDPRALAWTVVISILAGLLVGLAPAMAALRRNLRPTGEESGRTVSGGLAARRIRRALVVAELALAIVLLVGAGLLVRSWWVVSGIDPGFQSERVVTMRLASPTTFDLQAQRADLYRRVLAEIQALPGVERAGIIGDLFIGNSRERLLTVEGDAGVESERVRLARVEVSAELFATMGTPLLRGRFFTSADGPDAPLVAIVNESMARRAWPGRDAVGRRFKLGARDSDAPWVTVVGVVADMRRQGVERASFPQLFEPLAQSAPRSVDLFIRTSTADPLAMTAALRAAVRRVDTQAPIVGIAPLAQQLDAYLTQRRFQTMLLTGFAIVALLMAAVGIYGLIQYSIATRTQEIGLRLAIGAQAGDIFRMMIGEGLMLTLAGLGLGLAGAWLLGRAVSSLLFGITATDPWTFAAVALLLTLVALAASYFPARRAMKVDPLVALRAT